jgi:hypothetical protein
MGSVQNSMKVLSTMTWSPILLGKWKTANELRVEVTCGMRHLITSVISESQSFTGFVRCCYALLTFLQ